MEVYYSCYQLDDADNSHPRSKVEKNLNYN